VSCGTVTADDSLVFASGGVPANATLCIRGDGAGNVDSTHVVWQVPDRFYVPSLIVHGEYVFGTTDRGIAVCFDKTTGKEHWKHRLGGDFLASPTLCGDRIYIPDTAGRMRVLRAGPVFEILAEVDLADGGYASPSICVDGLFLRTNHWLLRISDSAGQ
jgi:hypothetical protein